MGKMSVFQQLSPLQPRCWLAVCAFVCGEALLHTQAEKLGLGWSAGFLTTSHTAGVNETLVVLWLFLHVLLLGASSDGEKQREYL